MLLVALISQALAIDVVWVDPVPDTAREAAVSVGATPAPRTLAAVRGALVAAAPPRDDAIAGLERALDQARPLEAQLDGELAILRLLDDAIGQVTVLRSPEEAGTLFRALAYQGFAANRYFGPALASDPAAKPWRTWLGSSTIERPWLDAVAIAPTREATAYDIAEAPQRVAFNQRRRRILENAPGLVSLPDLPDTVVVYVDGVAKTGASNTLTLSPGRHLVHAEWDGVIIEHWDVRLDPAQKTSLAASVDDSAFRSLFGAPREGLAVPTALAPLLRAAGPLYLGTVDAKGQPVLLDPSSGTLVALRSATRANRVAKSSGAHVELHGGIQTGWFTSADFYLQNPLERSATFATVNAIQIGGYATAEVVVGPAHLGVGLDVLAPLGEPHVALTGESSTRLRLVPHIAVGMSWAQLTAGFLLPYHPAIGARARLPLGNVVQLHGTAWWGPPVSRIRTDGSIWQGEDVISITGGIGARFGNTSN